MTMRIFSLVFLVAVVNSLVRINIWHDNLETMCSSQGDSLYQELIDSQKNLSLHLSSFHSLNLEFSNGMQTCQSDSNSKLKVDNFFDKVQLCMDEQSRLLEDQKQIFVTKLLEVLCHLFLLGGGKIDDQCSKMTEINFSLCRRSFREFPTILLPLIYSTTECSEARRLLNCFETGIRMCNESTRIEFESANNVTYYTLFDCQNIEFDEELPTFEEEIIYNTTEPVPETNEEFNTADDETLEDIEKTEDIRQMIHNQPMVRFNFTKTELQQKCNERGNDSLNSVKDTYTSFLKIKSDKLYLIRDLKERTKLKALVNENCYKAEDIRSNLNSMLNTIEQCLDEEDRLEEESKEILLNKSIGKFCSELENLGSHSPNDKECFHDSSTFFQLALCTKNMSITQFYFDNLPLLFISSPEECDGLERMHTCKLDVHGDCKDSTKNWLQEQFNEEKRYAGCKEVLKEITSND
ncbi:uncharacterized protein LOC122500886 [Leptopilina heterotoma]|uniref:uncharacterized protein LOC122500886 n=1 Tax=Leptopilina heterotoma TaxID=63436 RepID=UPI001CA97A53|nr:uncharacterized protein LOC122500886 [Leptopilina heterotoma]